MAGAVLSRSLTMGKGSRTGTDRGAGDPVSTFGPPR
jgi:hypothetical protein